MTRAGAVQCTVGWMCQGLDIPGMCHCLSLEMPQLQGQGTGRCHQLRLPWTELWSPHHHLLHQGIFKRARQETLWERRERKGSELLLSQPALAWVLEVFSWLCPGRLKGFCTIQPYPNVLLNMEKKYIYFHWKDGFFPERKKQPWCLSSLDVVFGITHPAFPELLTWGFNHDESSSQNISGF